MTASAWRLFIRHVTLDLRHYQHAIRQIDELAVEPSASGMQYKQRPSSYYCPPEPEHCCVQPEVQVPGLDCCGYRLVSACWMEPCFEVQLCLRTYDLMLNSLMATRVVVTRKSTEASHNHRQIKPQALASSRYPKPRLHSTCTLTLDPTGDDQGCGGNLALEASGGALRSSKVGRFAVLRSRSLIYPMSYLAGGKSTRILKA